MKTMADIKHYTDQIKNAVYGEEVRDSIVGALEKVNDDNNSYQDIKDQITADKTEIERLIEEFGEDVQSAEEFKAALESTINTGNTAKSNLEKAISNAETSKTNLAGVTNTANQVKDALNTTIENAEKTITDADTARGKLEASTSTANTSKTNLDAARVSAETALSNLNTAIGAANTLKLNLDELVSTANTAKSQLQTVINNADTIKANLASVINDAETAKTSLDASVKTANDVLKTLSAENVSAESNLSQLRSENFNSKEILVGVTDLKATLGLLEDETILGVSIDYTNNTFERLGAAVGFSKGADFDAFPMFGGRKRCNVADDGTIVAYYGDADYAEDGSMGQVMVYQPKFYYMTVPVIYEKQETGLGYHLRKANYYVSSIPHVGFSLHPAFFDENGNEVDYILLSAFEGSIYDANGGADGTGAYLLLDEQVADFSSDKFCSIAGAKPASGLTQNLTRPNVEQLAKNRGVGWHSDNIKAASANQYLMVVEMAMLNMQTAIGQGIVSITDNSSYNCSSLTGSTSALGNASGQATETINEIGGTQTPYTTSGKLAVTYRGMENPWGNLWKFVYGINIWGDGTMNGGQPFICSDFNFAESKRTDNYEGAGFCLCNANGYVKAFGYSQKYDWLFLPSEIGGTSSLPVGDYAYVTPNLNGYRIALLGGYWNVGGYAGAFYWFVFYSVGRRIRTLGGRLVYVPTAS